MQAQRQFDPSTAVQRYAEVRARLTRPVLPTPKITNTHFIAIPRYFAPQMSDGEAAMYEHSYLYNLARSIEAQEAQARLSNGEPSLQRLLFETAAKYKMTIPELIAARRDKFAVNARHEFMWRAKTETSKSIVQIGKACGGRDHTTVLHGLKVYRRALGMAR